MSHLRFMVDAEVLGQCCVPMHECVTVSTGAVDTSILSLLERNRFDQAPVYDSTDGRLLGLVETTRLRHLETRQAALQRDDEGIRPARLNFGTPGSTHIEALLKALRREPAMIYEEEGSDPIEGTDEWEDVVWQVGLITIADLNRQPFRAALYSGLALLEADVASLVEACFEDPWKWVGLLGEEHQARILGFVEVTRRNGLDINHVAAATLTQMLRALASRPMLDLLGYRSRSDFDSSTGLIPDVRNRVMHPVRPLILGGNDLDRLEEAIAGMRLLNDRVSKALETKRPSAHTRRIT